MLSRCPIVTSVMREVSVPDSIEDTEPKHTKSGSYSSGSSQCSFSVFLPVLCGAVASLSGSDELHRDFFREAK